MNLLPYEIWRDVPGFDGAYQASTMGNLRSSDRVVWNGKGYRLIKGKVLKPAFDGRYQFFTLYYPSNTGLPPKLISAHRIVATTFLPNPNQLSEINHKSEKTTDNQVSNLEWCSHNYNCSYGSRNKRIGNILKNHLNTSKPVAQYTKDMKLIAQFPSTKEVERQLGYHNRNISRCCNGERATAYGYIWRYVKNEVC